MVGKLDEEEIAFLGFDQIGDVDFFMNVWFSFYHRLWRFRDNDGRVVVIIAVEFRANLEI